MLSTRLSRHITLNNPIVSANMDTVTEDDMCIAMAKNGGIGFLHRFSSVAEQVEQVRRVKVRVCGSFVFRCSHTRANAPARRGLHHRGPVPHP